MAAGLQHKQRSHGVPRLRRDAAGPGLPAAGRAWTCAVWAAMGCACAWSAGWACACGACPRSCASAHVPGSVPAHCMGSTAGRTPCSAAGRPAVGDAQSRGCTAETTVGQPCAKARTTGDRLLRRLREGDLTRCAAAWRTCACAAPGTCACTAPQHEQPPCMLPALSSELGADLPGRHARAAPHMEQGGAPAAWGPAPGRRGAALRPAPARWAGRALAPADGWGAAALPARATHHFTHHLRRVCAGSLTGQAKVRLAGAVGHSTTARLGAQMRTWGWQPGQPSAPWSARAACRPRCWSWRSPAWAAQPQVLHFSAADAACMWPGPGARAWQATPAWGSRLGRAAMLSRLRLARTGGSCRRR